MAALSAAATGSLAGCQDDPASDDGDDGDPDLGERVPALQFDYWAGLGDTSEILADCMPIIEDNVNAIGIELDIQPVEAFTLWDERDSDQRNRNIHAGGATNNPAYLSPSGNFESTHIRYQGSTPATVSSHYASCEASRIVEELQIAASPEDLEELTHDLFSVTSEDVSTIPLFNRVTFGAYRTDQVEIPNPGNAGVQYVNPEALLTARATGDNPLTVNVDSTVVQSIVPTTLGSSTKLVWDHHFYSPLVRYDENWEMIPVFATDWEVSNEFQTITFQLRENAVFHNGDPITAEDVKWTFEFLNENSAEIQTAQSYPYESIEVVDDHTVTFNFSEPSPAFFRREIGRHGILPKDVWIEAGAEESPTEVDLPTDPYVGSGPHRMVQFTEGQRVRGEPFEDHWRTPESPIEFQGAQDPQSMARAFRQGELNVFVGVPPSIATDLMDFEEAEVTTTQGFSGYSLFPYYHFGPTKFREFRMAFSQALDRQQMVEIATFGTAMPLLYGIGQAPPYPYYPDNPDEVLTKVAETPQANPDAARQFLEEEGWGWDDNDRLHYPPDADLDPLWEQGETPRDHPDTFPCVEELDMEL